MRIVISIIVGACLGAVFGYTVYAFSAKTGIWDFGSWLMGQPEWDVLPWALAGAVVFSGTIFLVDSRKQH